jgi:hypothetical protein
MEFPKLNQINPKSKWFNTTLSLSYGLNEMVSLALTLILADCRDKTKN